ncbi:hypothetical protein [Aneurinibacillus migulanus]|uniref:hypothetical protein n=1 Tax=Aneurinibacillus migulanus TaxID=47500 RepID=UPI0006969E76|nr:hypothetical protein [Aneurinibacillus migulanus]
MRPTLQQKKGKRAFFRPLPPTGPSFFSYLPPQEFVDVSNQMYIKKGVRVYAPLKWSLKIGKKAYLSCVKDGATREIVAYHLSESL